MRFRKLRIAWSVVWGILTLVLIVAFLLYRAPVRGRQIVVA
jgi:hypothetical protein